MLTSSPAIGIWSTSRLSFVNSPASSRFFEIGQVPQACQTRRPPRLRAARPAVMTPAHFSDAMLSRLLLAKDLAELAAGDRWQIADAWRNSFSVGDKPAAVYGG